MSREEKVGPLSNTVQVLYVLKHVVINEKKKNEFIFLEEKGQHIIKYWNWCAKSTLTTLQNKLLITKETS